MLLREATSETCGPRVYSHHINLHYFILLVLRLLFTLHLYTKNTKNIISARSHSRKWPWRDSQPLSVGCELLPFCAGTRDLRVTSYWIDTLVLKNWRKYLRYCAASSSPLWGKPTQAWDVARRISGAVAGEAYAKVNIPSTHHNPYPSHYIICHLPLIFLSPQFTLAVLFALSLSILPLFLRLPFCPFVCSCVSLFACRHG